MKFPKERVVLLSKINEYKKANDYYSVFKLKDEILDNYEVLKDTDAFDDLVECTFLIGNFDSTVLIGDALMHLHYESYKVLYYMVLSYIANVDIYQGVLLVKRSELLKKAKESSLLEEDGANYSNIVGAIENSDEARCLAVVNFTIGLSKEMIGDIQNPKEYLLYRFFDLINMLYELGFSIDNINNLSRCLKIMFMVEI